MNKVCSTSLIKPTLVNASRDGEGDKNNQQQLCQRVYFISHALRYTTMASTDDDATKKVMVRGTISYLEAQGLPVNKSAIFRHFGLSRSQGYAAIVGPSMSKKDDPEWEESRGRPSKLSSEVLARLETFLWDQMSANPTWADMVGEARLDVALNPRTLRRAMGTLSYRRCLSCARNWTSAQTKVQRVQFAKNMLDGGIDWRKVRFSGELHFGFGRSGEMRLLPRAGERMCPSCVDDWTRDVRLVHAWAAVGHGFKSDLVIFKSGQLSMAEYRDSILEKVVKPWMKDDFVLWEDVDSFAHGAASKENIARQWKEDRGLKYMYGCSDSVDLSPLDAPCLWPPKKRWMREGEYDEEELNEAARRAWAELNVDAWVNGMERRLVAVVEGGGELMDW